MTEPSGARFPRGNVTVLVRPRSRALAGGRITSSGSIPSASNRRSRRRLRRSLESQASSTAPTGFKVAVRADSSIRPRSRRCDHDLRHTAGQIGADGGVIGRAVGQNAHEPGDAEVDLVPVLDRGPGQPRRERDGGNVQEQVGRASERGVDRHGVVHGLRGENLLEGNALLHLVPKHAGRPSRHVLPDRLARGSQGRVRHGHAECLGHDLRGGGGAEELAAATGRGAGPATQLGGLLEAQLSMHEPHADRLDLAGVLAPFGRQGNASGDDQGRQGRSNRPGPSSWRAGPCRRWPRPGAPGAGAEIGSAGAGRWRRRCGTAGCPSCPSCPESARRTGRKPSPENGSPPSRRSSFAAS